MALTLDYPTAILRIQMQIAVQPPSKTVYQRILKPFPSVYLILPPLHTNGTHPLPKHL